MVKIDLNKILREEHDHAERRFMDQLELMLLRGGAKTEDFDLNIVYAAIEKHQRVLDGLMAQAREASRRHCTPPKAERPPAAEDPRLPVATTGWK